MERIQWIHHDLEEAAKKFADNHPRGGNTSSERNAFIRGALWQHERDIALFELSGCSGPQYFVGESGDEVGLTYRVMQIIADCIRAHRPAHYSSKEN